MGRDSTSTKETISDALEVLEAHPDYRIIRRIVPRERYAESEAGMLLKAAIVDTETTGTNHDQDKIIELGMVLFEYDPETGQAYRVLKTFNELEDPGFPIPPEATAVNGITDAMLAGKRIDDVAVEAFLEGVSLVIAHNSAFDRVFLEKRLPMFERLHWGCSLSQVSWREEGIGSAKLDYIAFQNGLFYEAHRAEADCVALLEVLQQPLPKSGELALKAILKQSSEKSYRVFAIRSPFESKDLLKGRGYRWDAERKCWHHTVTGAEAIKSEVAWLKDNVYDGRSVELEFEVLDGLTRFSSRPGKKVMKQI
ncbi:3'-5' exonuclease [Noviherbaspirillum sp. UKPF54]|uniref:3'-5' exonuclease n=1 Tax=Noviherbaspirillum sp. UKPF54 TaxID=2601898 RepID=UPI0011B1980B|nr:3'-5' exonuclease [Noviherbaspirillum sp. UKPF54]QDZ26572.1 DNA polymerase III subunit epsilon [Noviherbaspirillum sp. UKPF54]